MRILATVTVALLLTGAAASFAQDGNSGTAPGGMGSTGWTGGNRGQTGGAAVDPEAAAQQPAMATGVDLNGPPRQFPPGQTPE